MRSTEIGLARAGRAITYLVYAFVIIALVILVLGFFLLLFGANSMLRLRRGSTARLIARWRRFGGIFEPV